MDYGYEQEALEAERFEADLLQYQYEQEARLAARQEAKGICQHNSRVGYRVPAVYPEQRLLKPGESMCTDGTGGCRLIAPDDIVEDEDGVPVWHYVVEWEPCAWADQPEHLRNLPAERERKLNLLRK